MMDSVMLADRVTSSPETPAATRHAGGRMLGVGNTLADIPAEPTSAFLLCRQDFSVVYVSGLLQIFLKLPDERGERQRRDLFSLLGGSGILHADSVETVLGPMRQSGLHCATMYLKTGTGEHSVEVHVEPAGAGRWMLAFEDAHANPDCRGQLLALTLTDPLVGTNNRRCFQQAVKSSLANNIPGTAMLLDLDRFKAVNDTLGHPVGDQLLRKVAERLRTVVGDGLLARLGGDEFAVWIDSLDVEASEAMAAKIVEMLRRPFLIDGQQVNIGASVGVAYATEDNSTYDRLMKRVDLALYAAKEAGRDCVRSFLPAMETAAHSRRKLELEVRKALTLRQFEVHYQPRINIESSVTVGVEAVLRWRHPDRGVLEPESFLGLAEEIGLTCALGKWMLKTICHDAAALSDVPRVSMRLMQAQFTSRESLQDIVKEALRTSGIAADRLELEITEETLLHHQQQVLQTLHSLRALGVSIGMGEFGTGYASLSKLVSFPFDRIRIASSLAREACPTPTHRAIIRAVAMLGSSLGVATLIDGIDTREQLERVRGDGSAKVQGCRLDEAMTTEHLAFHSRCTVRAAEHAS